MFTFYKKYLSPFIHSLTATLLGQPRACRFTPTCSEYSRQALKRYGIIHGSALSFYRFLRCSPLSKGGYDPLI